MALNPPIVAPLPHAEINQFVQEQRQRDPVTRTDEPRIPRQERPLHAFDLVSPNTVAVDGGVLSAIEWNVVVASHRQGGSIMHHEHTATTEALLCLTIPVDASNDPLCISTAIARATTVDRSHDDDGGSGGAAAGDSEMDGTAEEYMARVPISTGQLERALKIAPSVQMWYALCLSVLTGMMRLLRLRRESVCFCVQSLHKDSGVVGSPVKALRFVLRGTGGASSLQSYLDQQEEETVTPQWLLQALCLSARTVKGAFRLHRSLGMLATGDASLMPGSFTFLPMNWRRQLWQSGTRTFILTQMDLIFHGSSSEVVIPNESADTWEQGPHSKLPARLKAWSGVSVLLNEETGVHFDGFQTWFRHQRDPLNFNRGCNTLGQGLAYVLMQIGGVYGIKIDATNEHSFDLLLNTILSETPVSDSEQHQALHLFLERHFTYIYAGLEAERWGADPHQCQPRFYFRNSGYQGCADISKVLKPDQGVNKHVMVAPYLYLGHVQELLPVGDDMALQKAQVALEHLAVMRRITSDGYATSSAQLVLWLVNMSWWSVSSLLRAHVNLFALGTHDNVSSALYDVLSKEGVTPPGAFINALMSRWASVPVAAPALTSAQVQAMPMGSLCASHFSDTIQMQWRYVDKFALSRQKDTDVSRALRNQALSLLVGPAAIVAPLKIATVQDISSLAACLCGAMEVYISQYANTGVASTEDAYVQRCVEPMIIHWRNRVVRLTEALFTIASRHGYIPGRVTRTANHATVQYAEVYKESHDVEESRWPSVASVVSLDADTPPAFQRKRLQPACVMTALAAPTTRNLPAAVEFLQHTLHDVKHIGCIRHIGPSIVRLKMCQATCMYTVKMAMHNLVLGTSSSGKTLALQVCRNLGFFSRYIMNDGESARANVTGDESAAGHCQVLNETGSDLIGKARNHNSANGAGANTDSTQQQTLLSRLDQPELSYCRTTKVEEKTASGITITDMRPKWIPSDSHTHFTFLGNSDMRTISIPVACRVTPFLFVNHERAAGDTESAQADALAYSTATRVWEHFSMVLQMADVLVRSGYLPTPNVEPVAPFLTRFFLHHQERRLGQMERHGMALAPAFTTDNMKAAGGGGGGSGGDNNNNNNSGYTRGRVLDAVLEVMVRLCLHLRLSTTMSWLAPILNYIPGYCDADYQVIMSCFAVANAEDAMLTAWTQGSYDSLCVSTNHVQVVETVMEPVIRSFLWCLRLYAHMVRWAKGVDERFPVLNTSSRQHETLDYVLTPEHLIAAITNSDNSEGVDLLESLMRLDTSYWSREQNAWMLWISALFAQRCGTILHPSRFKSMRTHHRQNPTSGNAAKVTAAAPPVTAAARSTGGGGQFTLRSLPPSHRTPLAQTTPRSDHGADVMHRIFPENSMEMGGRATSPPTHGAASSSALPRTTSDSSEPPFAVSLGTFVPTTDEFNAEEQWHHMTTHESKLNHGEFFSEQYPLVLIATVQAAVSVLNGAVELWDTTKTFEAQETPEVLETSEGLLRICKAYTKTFGQRRSPSLLFLSQADSKHIRFGTMETQLRLATMESAPTLHAWLDKGEINKQINLWRDGTLDEVPIPYMFARRLSGLREWFFRVAFLRTTDKKLSQMDQWFKKVKAPTPTVAQQPVVPGTIWQPMRGIQDPVVAEYDQRLNDIRSALQAAHSPQKVIHWPTLSSGVFGIAFGEALQTCGYAETYAKQAAGVVIHPMNLYSRMAPTQQAIQDTLEELETTDDPNMPLIFTYAFDTPAVAVEGTETDGVFPIMSVPAYQQGKTRHVKVKHNSQAGVATRFQAIRERGYITQADMTVKLYETTDDYQFQLRMRHQLMLPLYEAVRVMFREACQRYVLENIHSEHSVKKALRCSLAMAEDLEKAFHNTPAARRFCEQHLFVKAESMRAYPGAAASGFEHVQVIQEHQMPEADHEEQLRVKRTRLEREFQRRYEEHKQEKVRVEQQRDDLTALARNMDPADAHRINTMTYRSPVAEALQREARLYKMARELTGEDAEEEDGASDGEAAAASVVKRRKRVVATSDGEEEEEEREEQEMEDYRDVELDPEEARELGAVSLLPPGLFDLPVRPVTSVRSKIVSAAEVGKNDCNEIP